MPAGDASILLRFLSFTFAATVTMPILETTMIIPGMMKLTVAELNIQLSEKLKSDFTKLRKKD